MLGLVMQIIEEPGVTNAICKRMALDRCIIEVDKWETLMGQGINTSMERWAQLMMISTWVVSTDMAYQWDQCLENKE